MLAASNIFAPQWIQVFVLFMIAQNKKEEKLFDLIMKAAGGKHQFYPESCR